MGTTPENLEPVATPAAPAPGGGRSITPAQIALVGGLVVILLGLAWFFFLRSPAEEPAPPPVTAPAVPAPSPTPEPTADDDDADEPGVVENFELFAPRDPFEPLVSANAGAAAPGTGTATGDGTTDDGTTDDGTTDGDGTVDGDGTTDGDTSDVGGHRVRVIDVFREGGRDRAQIQVDGTVYTVDEGEDFADNFRLVNASGRCATMLFGDDEFTLCEGEEILK